jgi:hypothetical protein
MSFQVVRHEHPNIFVVNRQTYETYRFTVGDDVMLSFDGAPSDLGEARRTAIAFLTQTQTNEYAAVCGECPTVGAILSLFLKGARQRCITETT